MYVYIQGFPTGRDGRSPLPSPKNLLISCPPRKISPSRLPYHQRLIPLPLPTK